jgi:cyclopropane fatty-acyl-phospholipid synthase-like methyltransferase
MQPANDSNIDYKALVQQGYDVCADAYEEARRDAVTPELGLFTCHLTDNARVLDIGCGAGVPITQELARQYRVTGVDISLEQIRRARRNVPAGTFVQGDIMSVDFPPAYFEGVVAFYAIFHLPREEHPELFRRIHTWLKTGGYLLVTVAHAAEAPYTEENFFGVTMYWSNYGLDDYETILREVGFMVLETSVVGHGYADEKLTLAEQHPIILAQADHD